MFRMKFFTQWDMRPWHCCQRAVGAPSLGVLRAGLDGALHSVSWWVVTLPMAGGWDWMMFKVPSNPSRSMIPWL